MDLSRWQVFSNLSRDLNSEVRLAYTWGSASGGYLVTNNDDVYCIGEHKARTRTCPKLKKMVALCGKGVKSFHSAYRVTLALATTGKLYQWISQVAVGELHILALNSDGKVFSSGNSSYGALGIGEIRSRYTSPQHANLNKKIVSVVCTSGASFALTDEGDVLSWGKSYQNGRSRSHLYSPGILLESKSVSQIVCGKFQGFGLTKDGNLYCWGMNDEDAGHRSSQWLPREICTEFSPVAEIAASYHNEFFVGRTVSQKIFVWGKWFGQALEEPVYTKYKSVDEAFACADFPTMWRTVAVEPSAYANLLKSCESAVNDEETSDVEFLVDGKKIFAHRVFLKFRVPYFRTMFEHNWKDSNQRVIKVENFTYNVFSAFISYVYTEKVKVKASTDLYGLFEAADYYNVQDLLEKCTDLLKKRTRQGNVCSVYTWAACHNAKNLQGYAVDYIVARFSKVVESQDFLKMDHLLSKQLIREAAFKKKLVDASDESSTLKEIRSSNENENEGPAQREPGDEHDFHQRIAEDNGASEGDSVVGDSDAFEESENEG